MVAVIFAGTCLAVDGNAQDILSRLISLRANDTKVRTILNSVEEQCGVQFVYSSKAIPVNRKISVNANGQKLADFLNDLLKPLRVTYSVVQGQIILTPMGEKTTSLEVGRDAPTITAPESVSEFVITGKVIDDQGEGLPGVNIQVKNQQKGTISDKDGNYRLALENAPETLVFSFVGYVSKEVAVGGRTNLDVTLSFDLKNLEEVVVVGYGTQSKTDVISSVATISPEAARKVPTSDIGEMLRGKAAGVQVTLGSAAPGSSSNILIRGQRSINGGNGPLIIVDGVRVGDINVVNASDVASIDILKDAAAQAIYGARASNGVILITTKTGASGKPKISYSGFAGVQQIKPNFDVFSGEEFVKLKREANRTVNNGNYLADDKIFSPDELAAIASGNYINWRDEVLTIAPRQDHTLSLSSGSDKTKIYTSVNYQSQDGVIPNTNFKRANIRFNLDQTINNWLKMGINSSAQFSRRNNPSVSDILAKIVYTPPLGQIYNEDGTLKLHPNGLQDAFNPLVDVNETSQITDDRNDLFRLYLDISPWKGFNYRISASRRSSNQKQLAYNTAQSVAGDRNGQKGQGDIGYTTLSEWQLENIFSYGLYARDHSLNLTFVQSVIENNYSDFGIGITNTSNDLIGIYGLSTAERFTPFLRANRRGLLSFAGRVEYNYARKYYITGSARSDGSSVFGQENKWGFFPAVSVGWNIHKEDFLLNNGLVNNLKFRASYGSVGNEGIQPYGSLSTAQQRNYIFGDAVRTGYSPSNTLPNPRLKWETSTTLNAAVDFGFWKNRLSGTLEFYNTSTKNLLINRSVNAVLGYDSFRDNIGEIRNKGLEFTANAVVVEKNDLNVELGFIFSRNRNKIVDLYGTGEDDIANRWFLGYPINVYYNQRGIGIWKEGEDIAGSWMPSAKPGDIKVEDVNSDGKLDAQDQVITSQDPKWRGTFSLNMGYKGFDLSAYVLTVQGITKENLYLNRYAFGGTLRGDRNQIAVDYWLPENPGGTYPRPTEGNDPAYVQTIGYQDASYVRLQTVTLGYTLPTTLLSKIKMSRVRLYVTGYNLLTKTDFLSYGPELNASSYPEARSVVGGLQVSF